MLRHFALHFPRRQPTLPFGHFTAGLIVQNQHGFCRVADRRRLRSDAGGRQMCRGRGGTAVAARWRRAMNRLVRLALQKFVRAGNLRIRTARGTTSPLATAPAQPVALRFTTTAAERGILLDPELRLGEAYMDGTLIVEQGSIADVLARAAAARPSRRRSGPGRAGCCAICAAACASSTGAARARRNVAHHYDLDDRLYSLFLDADRQYSCAYFETPGSIARRRAARQEAPSRRQAAARARRSACSTSAAAGAGSRSISPRSPARASPASRSRSEQLALARAARGREGPAPRSPISACRTIAT